MQGNQIVFRHCHIFDNNLNTNWQKFPSFLVFFISVSIALVKVDWCEDVPPLLDQKLNAMLSCAAPQQKPVEHYQISPPTEFFEEPDD